MADAGDLKSPARNGRVGSTPTSATTFCWERGRLARTSSQAGTVKDSKLFFGGDFH